MSPRIYELVKALDEYFAYGFPVYADSPLTNGETFSDRVAQLLRESTTSGSRGS